jgi:hypothetical protein
MSLVRTTTKRPILAPEEAESLDDKYKAYPLLLQSEEAGESEEGSRQGPCKVPKGKTYGTEKQLEERFPARGL